MARSQVGGRGCAGRLGCWGRSAWLFFAAWDVMRARDEIVEGMSQ